METAFSWRKTRASDLAECVEWRSEKIGSETVGVPRALKAWHQLFEITHACRSAVVELHSNGKTELVGFGLATFVKKSFADAEVLNPRPGLNARIIESIVSGNPVVATYEEVRDTNTQGELQQVVLVTSWKEGRLDPVQLDEVRHLLGRAYMEMFSGYHFGRVLNELVGHLDFLQVQGHKPFRIVDRYEAYRLANPDSPWSPDRALGVGTLESARTDPLSIAAGLFQHHLRPQFAFTQGEQELLEGALDGMDDEFAAKSLFVSLPAIKRRWANIFDRVAAVRPDICPHDGDGIRGVQKRQRILNYVRNHPEELRPFNFGKQKDLEK